jgi:hypothetical protein
MKNDTMGEIIDIALYLKDKDANRFDNEVKSVIKELTTCINKYQIRNTANLVNIQLNHF